MADEAAADEAPVTFHVKSSNDSKYTVTVPLSNTVLQLKEKLAGSDYADLPPERQRLIYSGRVLKDPDTLASYKIKEGNTVHLVKGAASNQRQNPATQGTGATSQQGATPAVPTNLSSGPGANNPLAGLTGARYAGLAHLPNQSMFGPDGGMGPPPDPEQIIQLLENPQFASTLNEALSNPQIVETMIQQNPMLREMGPEMRQMMQSPEFRRIMTDPQMLRSTMQMQRAFGGNPFGGRTGSAAFPAPGATDTTPAGAQASEPQQGQQGQGQQGQQQPPNPFAMFGGAGGQGAQAGNPFANLFNPAAFGQQQQQGAQTGTGTRTDPSAGTGTGGGQGTTSGTTAAGQTGTQAPGGGQGQGAPGFPGPYFNPALMAQLLGQMNNPNAQQGNRGAAPGSGGTAGGDAGQQGGQAGQGQQQQQYPAGLFNPALMAQLLGGMGGDYGGGAPQAPADTRPPEERYADQLRQLNDMGFYEFERNVEALRRSGGSVQGAVEYLLSQPPS